MLKLRKMHLLIAMLLISSLVLAACPAPAPAPADSGDAAEEPAEEAMEEEADEEDMDEEAMDDDGEIAREDTIYWDASARVEDPELWNPFVPGDKRSRGYHQVMSEPLFILNYETGTIDPWLGTAMVGNETMDVWTMSLREGVTWSDGEAFNADDVAFTINMLKENAPELHNSSQVDQWIDSVAVVDDLTLEFTLTDPNPRFLLDFFSVKIWGGINIVPQHIWEGQDPLTFKFYDAEQGWPVATGPYTLEYATETEWSYVLRDSWWGAETGFQDGMPAPERMIWTAYGPEETRTAVAADGEMDSLQDITLGAFQALQAKTGDAFAAWHDGAPYAWLDPCSRTFELNLAIEPWSIPEMRWALNSYIDRDQIIEIAYENTTIKSEHFFVAYPPLNAYVDLLRDNENFQRMQTTDVAAGDALLEGQGYAKNGDGYWERDGEVLSLQITTHEAFIEKQRIAQVLVEQFQAAGIDAVHLNEAGSIWGDNHAMGTFDSRMGWQTCGSINEPWASMDTMSTRHLVPVGERASGNRWRWSGENADAYSALVEEMGTLSLDDPRVGELFVEAMGYWLEDLPVIPISQARKLIPFDTTYWTGWPTAEDNYMHPPNWWQSVHMMIHELEPAE
ncbi:MAG: ABC transporter substrate-binding protein [Chloroflexota bacterium]